MLALSSFARSACPFGPGSLPFLQRAWLRQASAPARQARCTRRSRTLRMTIFSSLLVNTSVPIYSPASLHGDTAQDMRLAGKIPPIRVTSAATVSAADTATGQGDGGGSSGSLMNMTTATRM